MQAMNSDLFSSENMATPATAPGMTQQNAKSVKYALDGECYARQGSMIAYRGDLQFEKQGQGVGKFLKRAVTGEGLALMAVRGRGEVWFAHEAANCFLIDLAPGDGLTVNGRNVLCFDPSLSYEIKVVKGAGMVGGGLFNSEFSGQGRLAVMCEGNPSSSPCPPSLRSSSTPMPWWAGAAACRPRCTVRRASVRCSAAAPARPSNSGSTARAS